MLTPVGNFATAMEGSVGCHCQSDCCVFFFCLSLFKTFHSMHISFFPPWALIYFNLKYKFTSGSIGGYFLPLLFPKHFVFPPSRSWHQKPFWGSNLRGEEKGRENIGRKTEKEGRTKTITNKLLALKINLSAATLAKVLGSVSSFGN